MSRLHERSFYIKRIDLIQHTLNESLNRILRRTKGSKARHTQRATRAAEDEIPPAFPSLRVTLPEIRKRELDDVECAPEVGLELVADLVFVLVFAGADNAVAGAVGDDVDARPVRDAGLNDGANGVADADVAEKGKIGGAEWGGRVGIWFRGGAEWRPRGREPGVHVFNSVRVGAADGCDEVAMGKGGFDNRATDVARSPKYLIRNIVSSVLFIRESQCFWETYNPYSLPLWVLRPRWIAAGWQLKL